MELAVVDLAKLRLVQAATEGPWKPGAATPTLFHVIRLEPSGRAVGTNNVALVVADLTVEPFEGEPIHIIPESQIPKAARTARIEGDTLITDKGTVALRTITESSTPALTPYYRYEAVLERVAAGGVHPRGEYRWNHAQLDRLVKAHPAWPKEKYFDLKHVTQHSIQIDMRMDGVTALLAMARPPER